MFSLKSVLFKHKLYSSMIELFNNLESSEYNIKLLKQKIIKIKIIKVLRYLLNTDK